MPSSPGDSPAFDRRREATDGRAGDPHAQRMHGLIEHLPSERLRRAIRWLLKPAARWARIPAGVLLIIGGVFSILPVLGLWMLPLGVLLLAEDVPPLRRLTDRVLDWIERRRPHWFAPPRRAADRA